MSTSPERYRWLNHRTELPLLLLILGAILIAGATGFLRGSQPTTHLTAVQAIRIADQPSRVHAQGNMVLENAVPHYTAWNINGAAGAPAVWVVSFKGTFVRVRRIDSRRHCYPPCKLGTFCPLPQPLSTSGASIVQPIVCLNVNGRRYAVVTVYVNDANGKWLEVKYSKPTKFSLPPVFGGPPVYPRPSATASAP